MTADQKWNHKVSADLFYSVTLFSKWLQRSYRCSRFFRAHPTPGLFDDQGQTLWL